MVQHISWIPSTAQAELLGRDVSQHQALTDLAKLRKSMLAKTDWNSRDCYRWADEMRRLARSFEDLAEEMDD